MIPEKYYQSRLESALIREKKLKRILNQVSILRLVFMVLFVFLLVRGINYNNFYVLGLSLISLILFFYLVSYHNRKSDERKKNRALIEINEKERKALKGDYSNFFDGKEFLNPEHEFTYDLDIFGAKSIYQFICRCCTIEGRRRLATKLLNSPFSEQDIYRDQQIHEELSENPDFIQDYLSTGNLIQVKEQELYQLRSWLKNDKSILPQATRWVALFLMLLNISLLVATIVSPGLLNYFIISVLLNWFFYGLFMNAINRYHSEISKKQEVIKKYNNLSLILVKHSFKNSKLRDHKGMAGKSIKEVKRLGKLIDLFDSRLNLLMGAILNTLFLLDIHLIFILERWKKQNRNLLSEDFRVHAEIEA
jgi:Ca2+/Na+ antiporter